MSIAFDHIGNTEAYARAALDRECEVLASTRRGRNAQANLSGFNVGQLVGAGALDRHEAERRLFAASETNGYVGKDGAPAARATIKSGLDDGQRKPRTIPEAQFGGARRPRHEGAPERPADLPRAKPKLADVPVPDWTEPGADGKPKFIGIGQPEPIRFSDEVRRHAYTRDGAAVRVKTKNREGKFTNWYRVRRPGDGAIGWQARKPAGWIDVPYLPPGAPDPFDPARRGEAIVWAEGEKDADAAHANGFHSFTFGSAGDVPDVSDLLSDHAVIIVVDNDEAGRGSIPKKVGAAIHAGARSIRLVQFPELADGGDLADFFAAGGDAVALLDRAEGIDPATWTAEPENSEGQGGFGPRAAAAGAGAPPTSDDLDRLNAEFCVVLDCGRARVLHFEEERQEHHKRQVANFLSFEDFRNFHMNRFVEVGEKRMPLGQWWLRHADRRQYRGLTFEPGAERELDGRLNLWRGWGVGPKAGDWSRMKAHIRDVLAGNDTAFHDYIMRWIAWAVQHPAERAQAALVFKGKKGTGKGTLGNALCRIFGQHGTHISTAEHLAGRFNGHLRDACFLFADEAYWPGDKGAEGSLKRLVTEPDLFIEAKGRDGITVPNMLHVMMASNDDWIVPAGEDERRYAVFGVSDLHKQDERWFGPLNEQMEAGGYEAMLHDLLRHEIGDWHPRRIPRTEALLEQQSRGLSPEDAWWCELLETGLLWGSDPTRPECAVSNGWEEKEEGFTSSRMVKRKGLYDQARDISPRLRSFSDHLLAAALSKNGCSNAKKVMRRRGWQFPDLSAARAAWEKRYRGWQWRDPDIPGWQKEP